MPAPTMSSFSTLGSVPSGAVGGAGGFDPRGGPPTGSVDDLFGQLQEFQWKGIAFPAEETDFEIRHDLVIHRFADRNGSYLENTGRHPVQFTAQIPFLNQIYPAQNESWPAGALYPYQWRQFIAVCLDTTSGALQHPELGLLNCKLDLAKTRWSGKVRGGVIMQVTWIESDDTQADQLADLSTLSTTTLMTASANDLDANILTLQTFLNAQQPLPLLPFSFDALANAIVGVIDTPTLLQKEFQGRVQNMIYQADRVVDAIQQNPILGPLTWPIFQAAQRVKDTAYDAAAQPAISGGQPVLTKRLAKSCTVSQAALFCGTDVTSFITLNYALVGLSIIPSGTTVKYFAQAA